MKVSQEVVIGLKRLANPSLVSDENVEKLLRETSSFLVDPKNHKPVDIPSNTPKIDILKESYASLVCLLVEAIRHNVELEKMSSLLEMYKFNGQRLEKIMRLYTNHRSSVQNSLKHIAYEPPHVYDVKWRINYCVKSSYSDLEDKLVYCIDLITGQTGSSYKGKPCLQKITFICTAHHLQELVGKLKAATRQLEAVANVGR